MNASTWGKIQKYDSARAAAAEKLPANKQEFSAEFKDELVERIKYNLTGEVKIKDDGSIDAADAAASAKYAKKPGQFPDEYAVAAGALVGRGYEQLKGSGQSQFTYEAIADEAIRQAEALWARVDTSDPATLSTAEVKKMQKADAALGFFAKEASDQASSHRGSKAGTYWVDDPAVKKLHTPDDFLKYNATDAADGDKEIGREVKDAEIPASLKAAVDAAAAEIESRLKPDPADEDPDYTWGLDDIRAVYKTPDDHEIVGYVLRGSATYDHGHGHVEHTLAVSMNGKTIVDDTQGE